MNEYAESFSEWKPWLSSFFFSGHIAWGHENIGSYFIKTLCGVLQEYGGDYHLSESVAKVNEVLADSVRQEKKHDVVDVGEVQHSLTSKLYFTPSGTFEDFVKSDAGDYDNNVRREDGSKRRTVIKVG